MNDDPPLRNLLAGIVFLLLMSSLSITLPVDLELPRQPTISVEIATIPHNQLVLINNNSVVGLASPPSDDKPLASLTGIDILDRIVWCESKGNPTICNQEYGCGAGIGLGQLTAVAITDCENHLGKKIDPRNADDNIECSIWLYETYGTKPWGTADTWWGSYHCWSK